MMKYYILFNSKHVSVYHVRLNSKMFTQMVPIYHEIFQLDGHRLKLDIFRKTVYSFMGKIACKDDQKLHIYNNKTFLSFLKNRDKIIFFNQLRTCSRKTKFVLVNFARKKKWLFEPASAGNIEVSVQENVSFIGNAHNAGVKTF